jgi:hypothetical protein
MRVYIIANETMDPVIVQLEAPLSAPTVQELTLAL